MNREATWLDKTIVLARLTVAVFFLLFAEYKLFGPSSVAWVTTDFPKYLHGYVSGSAIPFYQAFLNFAVVPHAVIWAYASGVIELAIGISLLLGLWVRAASIGGILWMLNFLFATWFAGGHPADWWKYVGGQLDNLSLLMLFVIFAVAASTDPWALDRRVYRKRHNWR
jgi:uncharacterized membrane protein YphA (DoxX/SURF4 family)